MNAAPSVLDQAIQAATPLLAQPHHGALAPVPVGGKRIVAVAAGLQIQARTHVLDLALSISNTPLPYGPSKRRLRLPAGPIPRSLLQEFVSAAQSEGAREVAAAIVLGAGGYDLLWPRVESSSGGHVRYDDSQIDDDCLLIDLHSHGSHPAYFSSTDDASDLSRRGPYIAMVVGRCNTPTPDLAIRLVLPPYLIPLSVEAVKAARVFK